MKLFSFDVVRHSRRDARTRCNVTDLLGDDRIWPLAATTYFLLAGVIADGQLA